MKTLLAICFAAVAAVGSTGIAQADTTLDYAFSPGTTFDLVGFPSYDYTVTGDFSYDTTFSDATSESVYFSSAGYQGYASGVTVLTPSDLVFTVGGNPFEFEFAQSLAAGGVDVITGGDTPGYGFTILATGSAVASSVVSAAPEPSTWALMFAGVAGIGLMLRRTRKTMDFRFKTAEAA
jgi:hypothetical protein